MSAKVIPMRPLPHHRPTLTLEETVYKQKRAEQRRLIAIEKIMADRPVLRVPERLVVAENLWRLLSKLEDRDPPIKKKDVLHASGQGHEYESTKRLPRFAINPALSDEDKRKRSESLTKKILPYVNIVRNAAIMAGEAEGEFVLELIQNTSYVVTDSEIQIDSDLDCWDDLVLAITTAVEDISRRYNLNVFFDRVRSFHANASFVSETGKGDAYRSIFDSKLPLVCRDADLPPRPSYYLGDARAHPNVPCLIKLQLFDNDPIHDRGNEAAIRDQLVAAGLEHVTLNGSAVPVFEVWLDLLPSAPNRRIRPVLRVRSRTYIYADESFEYSSGLYSYEKCIKGDVLGFIDGPVEPGRNRVYDYEIDEPAFLCAAFDGNTSTLLSLYKCAEFPSELDNSYEISEHLRISEDNVLLVSLNEEGKEFLLKSLIKPLDRYPNGEFPSAYYCHDSECASQSTKSEIGDKSELSVFGNKTMLAALERSLLDAPDDCRLDRVLEKSTARLVQKLDETIEAVRLRRQQKLGELMHEHGRKNEDTS
ncbi:hypothetical protein [uncultured Rhodoblastus sp.]|uniref:hypothetical protein n=1 Tax=uncultured Rhodoblastus sp. TaxID=543037 RepID=UPI0025E5BF16|nr:hypothetical protein [uncultured Rhodoblastus sp.]